MIEYWNETVKPEDTIYHLGDFALCNRIKAQEIFNRLNGCKLLAIGNHESTGMRLKGWYNIKHTYTIADRILLKHFRPFWESPQSMICLHGHSHGNNPPKFGMIDIGVDAVGFKPLEIDDAVERAIQSWR